MPHPHSNGGAPRLRYNSMQHNSQSSFDWQRHRSMRPTTARRTHTSWVGTSRAGTSRPIPPSGVGITAMGDRSAHSMSGGARPLARTRPRSPGRWRRQTRWRSRRGSSLPRRSWMSRGPRGIEQSGLFSFSFSCFSWRFFGGKEKGGAPL